MLTGETQVVRFAVVRYHGDSNPKIEHENKKKSSNISYSMVLTVVVLSVEAFCFERRFTSPRLEHWKTPPSWIQHVLKNHHMVSKQDCDVAVNSDTHQHKHLLLATKPNYRRGRVGCPSDTCTLKTNSKCQPKVSSLWKKNTCYISVFFFNRDKINYSF